MIGINVITATDFPVGITIISTRIEIVLIPAHANTDICDFHSWFMTIEYEILFYDFEQLDL